MISISVLDTAIKSDEVVLPVKGATKDELHKFASHLEKRIATRAVTLVDPLREDQVSNTKIDSWLDKAIDNLYKCMYQAAKDVGVNEASVVNQLIGLSALRGLRDVMVNLRRCAYYNKDRILRRSSC
ncbi:unnamed protein product [Phytophthora fragariaefolia]|uniref:Unnamed protein product n=1 Tax=Phytophthora fragariaefolia TaxID=1490495 RepID=A0A9W6TMD3_9STRA|nr:unnamed protein product [Phytophthora fragariaefolia]